MPADKAPDASAPMAGPGEAHRPTVMQPPTRRRLAATAESAPTPASPSIPPDSRVPTKVRGSQRLRIEASAQELHALWPECTRAVCDGAVQLLAGVVADRMTERKAVLWGHELQRSYGAMVAATLVLVQDPLAEQARGHVDRMTQLLGSIDLMAVCGHGKGGLLARLAGSMKHRVDTPGQLAGALDELHRLVERLGTATTGLAALADRLHQQAEAVGVVEREVEAAALAALFLARRHERDAPGLGQRFTDRAMSLTATAAQMRQGDAVHRLQLQQPLTLIGVIQEVALVALPGFLVGLAALLALAQSRGATPTDARDMDHQLRNILNQLGARET